MPKGIFFSVPSVSVNKTLAPVIGQLAMDGCNIVYYNTHDFEPKGSYHFKFKPYPRNFRGYYSDRVGPDTSYFQFGDILVDATAGLVDFLLSEVEIEEPDFIVHSHLAVWGKLIAKHFKLPNITLNTTFILDEKIMFPILRKINAANPRSLNNVSDAVGFLRKSYQLYKHLALEGKPDPWDIYINKGVLNIAFILGVFQPQKIFFGDEYKFVGFPIAIRNKRMKRKVIYVSMGTIVNGDTSFYNLCIRVLKDVGIDTIISVGSKVDISQLDHPPPNIHLVNFVDQREVLEEAILFLTRGGMASVHEALYALAPMIVIPVIPEQKVTAELIQELGIGIHLSVDKVTDERLREAIQDILISHERYVHKLKALADEAPAEPSQQMASRFIMDFLERQ